MRRLDEERDRRIEQRFNDLEKTIGVALVASEKAIIKAEHAVEKRFDSVNEFRTTLSDQATNFITRAESNISTDRNAKDIQELKDRMNTLQGRGAGLSAGWGYLVGGIGLLGAVLAFASQLAQ